MPIGQIAFLGSCETSLAGGRIFESLARNLPEGLKIALLETPAGFELNSAQVTGRVAEFMQSRLQNYKPQVDVIPARKRGTEFSPNDPDILKPLLTADMIFMDLRRSTIKRQPGVEHHPGAASPRRYAGICFRRDDLYRGLGFARLRDLQGGRRCI
jgi:hypothetical protein